MKKIIILLVVVSVLPSFRWPVNNGRITSTFGEYRPDHFHDGVDMISGDFKTYPIADGELLYAWNREIFPFDDYTGSGNYKIVSHGKTASVYLHLDNSDNMEKRESIDTPLARFANTGRSYGNHIHFGIIDLGDYASVNPETVMPASEDKIAPEMMEIAFIIDGKLSIVKNKSTIRLTKNHPVLVRVLDSRVKGDRLGVYSLSVDHNDRRAVDYAFDRMVSKNGKLLIGGRKFDEIYNAGYYVIDGFNWTQGENRFRVRARDFSGNEKTSEFVLNANLEF